MINRLDLITFAEWSYDRHDNYCNQKYGQGDELPYSFHLKAVLRNAQHYKFLLTDDGWIHIMVEAGAVGHDLLEDARVTYNDVVDAVGKEIADIIYACTEVRGHNRGERHSQEFFDTLKENRLGVYVKLCDILANATFSRLTWSSMWHKYYREFPNFFRQLYVEGEYEDLWNDLKEILKIK